MIVSPSVITYSSSSLAPQNMETIMTLEELFYMHSYPCMGNGDQEWCARATIKAMCKADINNVFTYSQIKTYVEQRYGLI